VNAKAVLFISKTGFLRMHPLAAFASIEWEWGGIKLPKFSDFYYIKKLEKKTQAPWVYSI
jgi:hypothetical protein